MRREETYIIIEDEKKPKTKNNTYVPHSTILCMAKHRIRLSWYSSSEVGQFGTLPRQPAISGFDYKMRRMEDDGEYVCMLRVSIYLSINIDFRAYAYESCSLGFMFI